MNIFGSSAPSPEEVQRESVIKSQITENLKEAIKRLQKVHINSDEPIYSEDSANAVCNVLEATFLHGLKAPVSKKLTYLAGYDTNCTVLSFWGLLQKITHKDTLLQLTQLRQISTEIGLCRAWLRLALNDGLLESYLNAVINDEKTLRYYYKRTSYLRDTEHPGILMTYTQSLSHFQFELAYNASVLNIWTHTPLMLAGLVTPQLDPRPVIAREHYASKKVHHVSKTASQSTPVINQKTTIMSSSSQNYDHHTNIRSPNCDIAGPSCVQHGDESMVGLITPPNTPYDPSELTGIDIEAIRSLTYRDGSDSSSTGTSQISHPDPVDARQLIPNLTALHIYSNPPVSSLGDETKLPSDSHAIPTCHPVATPNEVESEPNTYADQESSVTGSRSSLLGHVPELSNSSISPALLAGCQISDNMKTANIPKKQHIYEDSLNPFSQQEYDNSLNPFSTDTKQSHELMGTDQKESLVSSERLAKNDNCLMGRDTYKKSLNPFDCSTCDKQEVECCDETNPFHSESSQITMKQETSVPEHCDDLRTLTTEETISSDSTTGNKANSSDPSCCGIQTAVVTSHPPDNPFPSADVDEDMIPDEDAKESATEQNNYDLNPSKEDGEHANDCDLEASGQSQPAAIRANRSSHSLTKSLSQSSSFPKFDVGKSPPLEPVLSTAMATSESVELAKEAITGLSPSLMDNLTGSLEVEDDDYQPKGNSLRFMEGWSSDFEASMRSERDIQFTLSDNHVPSLNNTHESFNSMLQNYGSTISHIEIRTISEVIDGLPDLEVGPYIEESSGKTLQKTPSSGDEVIAEYEVLPDIMERRAYLMDPMYQPLLDILGTVTTENGLDVQNFQCKGCSRPIGMFYGKPRVCGFDSCYYCFECHENDEDYIPARIIFNWDFRKQKVCHQNHKFLQLCEDDPVLNIQVLNPKLYDHVPEMKEVKDLRVQLRYLKTYLFTCKQSVADSLKKQIWPREYYYEDVHLYSLYDLLQVATGQLARTLSAAVKFASKHVYECGLCSQKGFICEICSNPKVIYPFEVNNTIKCGRCHSVYHKDCRSSVSLCPKCERRMKFHHLQGDSSQMSEGLSDYSFPIESSSQVDRFNQFNITL